MTSKYWLSTIDIHDDFGIPYNNVMYDAKTKMGPWANMSEESWMKFTNQKLGLGIGQKYKKQIDGRWLKVAG